MPRLSSRQRLGLPFRHPAVLIATWFGSGLLPMSPGTWGSLAALPFGWAIRSLTGEIGLAAAAVLAFVAGCWASAAVTRASGADDPGVVVIDEVAAQWLTLLVVPLHLVAYVAAFVLFRIFDIAKPWPVSWADREVHGGIGVMLDDVLAAGYAAAILWLVMAFGVRL